MFTHTIVIKPDNSIRAVDIGTHILSGGGVRLCVQILNWLGGGVKHGNHNITNKKNHRNYKSQKNGWQTTLAMLRWVNID